MTILSDEDLTPNPNPIESYSVPGFGNAVKNAWENRDQNLFQQGLNYVHNKFDLGQTLTQDQAQAKMKTLDVQGMEDKIPAEGIGENHLNSMIQERQDDEKRADLANRAQSKVGNFFGTLAGGLTDPLGYAASLIPFVGAARYTALLEGLGADGGANLGRTLVAKTIVGAAQGAGTMAAMEPATVFLGNQLGKDYDYTQSLERIGFGALQGGGLHALTYGLGTGIPEALSRFTDSERADVMHTAVTSLVEDKPVQVDQVVKGYEMQHAAEAQAKAGIQPSDLTAEGNQIKQDLIRTGTEKPGTDFENPDALMQQREEAKTLPSGPEVDVAKAHAEDAMNDVKGKLTPEEIESNPDLKAADEQMKQADERDTIRRHLTICAQNGEG